MLSKKQRLNRTEFSASFQIGRRAHSPHLTVITVPAKFFKCAVVVSKKAAKKAHDRNRIRRRLYALIELYVKEKNWQGVCIVVAKPAISKLTKRQFTEKIEVEIAQALNTT